MPPLLDLRPDELVNAISFDMIEEYVPGIRISIYEEPHPRRQYVMGADFALGTQTGDWDALCVLDNTDARKRQVAEVEAKLGEEADKVIFALSMYYGGCFLVGERQFGLPSLRRLLKLYGHSWMYYERGEDKKHRDVTDKLGYFKRGNWTSDPALRNLRAALRHEEIDIRSVQLINQLSKLQFKPRDTIEPEEARDSDLQVKLAGGGSPDLVMALAYAYHGCHEVDHYPPPKRKYAYGSAGDILGHDEVFGDAEEDPGYRPNTPTRLRSRPLGRIGD